jgi:hypothetical protein
MINYNTLKTTVYVSIFAQIITGIITFLGVFYEVPSEHMILKDINYLELIVQFIEFIFYIYISIAVLKVSGITPRRYFDWFITTPAMLLSTILFFRYKSKLNKLKSKNISEKELKEEMKNIRFMDIVKEEKYKYIIIAISNALMLLFGLLGELGIINLYLSNILGFIFFIITFYILYGYIDNDKESFYLYLFFVIVWSLYGVAQLFPVIKKNISYNFLDIIAKNFYGLYIFWKIYNVKLNNIL